MGWGRGREIRIKIVSVGPVTFWVPADRRAVSWVLSVAGFEPAQQIQIQKGSSCFARGETEVRAVTYRVYHLELGLQSPPSLPGQHRASQQWKVFYLECITLFSLRTPQGHSGVVGYGPVTRRQGCVRGSPGRMTVSDSKSIF